MKRLALRLEDVAARENLLLAVHKAARGKRHRAAVQRWLARLEPRLDALAADILAGRAPQGRMRRFVIHDPKEREISAVCFADRVLHHAIFNLAEPRLEQMLVATTFACRPGRGVHAAVAAVQHNLRRWPWLAQVDVKSYFASIDHARLMALLRRRIKGEAALALLERVIRAGALPGATRGLPIGSLSSQHFANAYLDGADRWLLSRPGVRAMVRYMDDIVFWCDSPADAHAVVVSLREMLRREWALELKPRVHVGPSRHGLLFCGFRVRPGVVLASARKMRRYRQGAERLCAAAAGAAGGSGGSNDGAVNFQRAHDVLAATLAHVQSRRFRGALWERLGGYSAEL